MNMLIWMCTQEPWTPSASGSASTMSRTACQKRRSAPVSRRLCSATSLSTRSRSAGRTASCAARSPASRSTRRRRRRAYPSTTRSSSPPSTRRLTAARTASSRSGRTRAGRTRCAPATRRFTTRRTVTRRTAATGTRTGPRWPTRRRRPASRWPCPTCTSCATCTTTTCPPTTGTTRRSKDGRRRRRGTPEHDTIFGFAEGCPNMTPSSASNKQHSLPWSIYLTSFQASRSFLFIIYIHHTDRCRTVQVVHLPRCDTLRKYVLRHFWHFNKV